MENEIKELIKELKDREKSLKFLKKNPNEGFWTKHFYMGALQENAHFVSKLKKIIVKNKTNLVE